MKPWPTLPASRAAFGRKTRYLLVSFVMSMYCPLLSAQERAAPLSAEYMVKTVLGLIVVIAIMLGLAWFMRRMGKMNGLVSGQIKILSALSVGTREKILLVEVGGEQFLLGATQTNINRLARIRTPIDTNTPAVFSAEKVTFQSLLAKLRHGAKP